MGLGLLGRGVGDVAYLARQGAELIVTDMKSPDALASSLEALKDYPEITYRLGAHELADFEGRDLIIKGAGVPLDSPYIAHAQDKGVPVTMSSALFAKLSGAHLVGVTGTRGKSTTTHLLYEIAKEAGLTVHLGGNIRGVSTLALLDEVEEGDWVVLELDSWQLQGFGYEKVSPEIAIFTNLMADHMDYYNGNAEQYLADKENIFLHQDEEGVLIAGTAIAEKLMHRYRDRADGIIVVDEQSIPEGWELAMPGLHNKRNSACAMAGAMAMGVSAEVIEQVLGRFRGVAGRLEKIAEKNGVSWYNDTTATTPSATIAALEAISSSYEGKIVLILGGNDKGLPIKNLVEEIQRSDAYVILLPGTGSDRVAFLAHDHAQTMEAAVEKGRAVAQAGGVVLLSPAFTSFGLFNNEFHRGDTFVEAVTTNA